ncbi:DUF5995 family protein [Streptomyces sp. Da 82-17]|uniref:DUF5995 family protein n=1 Tax=Streptomyces sp. Da 82-17 TaxID=3377116 RepID=UPI0038D3EB6B
MALSGQIGTGTVEAGTGSVGTHTGPPEADDAVEAVDAVDVVEAVGSDAGPVLARLRAAAPRAAGNADRPQPRPDGLAAFHHAYVTVAEEHAAPAVPLRLRLAERYSAVLDAARRGHRPPAAWRPLFQFRRHPGVRPPQFALAGLNAHIGYDLPLAVVDVCRARGCEPAAVEAEFDRVGDLLGALEERLREDLVPSPELLQVGDPLTHLLGAWHLERARDAAWSAARVLWGLRERPEAAREFTEHTDAGAGLVGHCLLTPWR